MSNQTQHISVLLKESVDALNIKADGIYVDGTFGRGGHSRVILSQLCEGGRLYAIDRDLYAIEEAKTLADDPRFHISHNAFSQLDTVADGLGIKGKIDGLLLDLGVSSPQLDDSERGFSFMRDGPLDMRMDVTSGITAAQWIAEADVEDISWVFKTFGEEPSAWRIAQRIVAVREQAAITRTAELAELIKDVAPKFKEKKHPATRCFQAIRIYINSELDEIKQALEGALTVLKPGGRLVVISFHSLEDRIVKLFMRKHAKGEADKLPRDLPIIPEAFQPRLKLIGKPQFASEAELKANPRSRSAVMRVAEKVR